MSRYIDADELIEDAKRLFQPDKFNHAYVRRRAIDLINNAPTVDVEPVKHGRWELVMDNINQYHFICPYCGEWKHYQEQKYCGECGAKMDEVSE